MNRFLTIATAALAGAALAGCGAVQAAAGGGESNIGPPPPAAASPRPSGLGASAPEPHVNLTCTTYNDPLGNGALGSGPTPEVVMSTDDFVNAPEITVTVIDFGQDGNQVGTSTITFSGPFAGGQTFTGRPDETDGDTSYCQIADVSSSVPFTYTAGGPAELPVSRSVTARRISPGLAV